MLDILIPIHTPNLQIARTCIEAIDRHTRGIPYRIVLLMDGVTRADYAGLEMFMRQRTGVIEANPQGIPLAHQLLEEPTPKVPDWVIVDWPGQVYWQGSLDNALNHLKNEFTAIMPPWVELRDDRWFGKLQQPFTVEPHTMLVAFPEPEAPPGTQPPAKFGRRKHPLFEAILTRRVVAGEIISRMQPNLEGQPMDPKEWVAEFSRVAEERGGTRWLAPSVRFFVIEHQPHTKACQQPESSGTPAPKSASPSPTTPVSSTPTTTDQDGIGVSVPF